MAGIVKIELPNGTLNGTSHPVLPAEEIRKHETEKSLGTSSSSWVVQKFGGTALGKAALGITDVVKNGLVNDRLAIVCSARSSSVKSDGTTTRLLRAAKVAAAHVDRPPGLWHAPLRRAAVPAPAPLRLRAARPLHRAAEALAQELHR